MGFLVQYLSTTPTYNLFPIFNGLRTALGLFQSQTHAQPQTNFVTSTHSHHHTPPPEDCARMRVES